MITLEQVRRRAEEDAKSRGYSLNYDQPFLTDLLEGLRKNEERFGYPSCPCRIAAGNLELDRDIICPCDYRDPDVLEFGACYCALFVSNNVAKDRLPVPPVPERRPQEKQERALAYKLGGGVGKGSPSGSTKGGASVGKKLWYCKQCGYVVFREEPPYICPICRAKKELFSAIELAAKDAG